MTDPSQKPATSDRALVAVFAALVLGALWLLTRSWHASLLDRYEFRQLQTAVSAWWMAAEGWRLDYLTPLFGPPWSVPMEFPTYQFVVAQLHHLTGLPLDQAGRLASILFLLATLPALHDLLAVSGMRASRRLLATGLVLTAPVYLFYGRAFMIETAALCFSVWFLALLRRALARPGATLIAATTLLAVLAALTKITTYLVFGLPALALVLHALRAGGPGRAGRLAAAAIPAALSLGLAWWWVRHGDAVKDSNPFTGFLTARELHDWNFGPLALRGDWSFWLHLHETVVGYNLAEGAIAVALLCVPFAAPAARRAAAVALAGFLSGPLVFANLYHIHDYYYAANALLLVGAAGLLLASAWDNPRLPRGANWLALGIIVACQGNAFYRGYYSHHRQPAPPPPALAAVIRQAVPPEGVVLIYGADWNPLLPYYMERRALMVPGERENETDVLEQVLARLPPRHIAAMVVHGDRLRHRADFIRERTARFGLSPVPAAGDADNDLYLPGSLPAAAPPPPPVADDAFAAGLKAETLPEAARALFSPAPVEVRSRYGVSFAELDGRPILNAHAPSELVFAPPPGSRRLHAVAGLPDGAFAPGGAAVTDGITIEVIAETPAGARTRLFQRTLDPAREPADRGPQSVDVDLPPLFTGRLRLRLGNGPKHNPTNDWAYWAGVEIR